MDEVRAQAAAKDHAWVRGYTVAGVGVLMPIAHITTRERGNIPGKGSRGGLCGPAPHWLWHSEELAHCSLVAALGGWAGRWVSQAQGHECERVDPTTHLSWSSKGVELTPLPLATKWRCP